MSLLIFIVWIVMFVRFLCAGSKSIEAFQQFGASVVIGLLAMFLVYM
jgi:hypothetical protein